MNNTTTSFDVGPDAEHIVVIIIGGFGVLFNSATLLVLLTNFTRIFGNAEACFVTSLAVADLLTSLGAMIWGSWPALNLSYTAATALLCAIWISVAASFLTLSSMAFERLLVISYPLKGKRVFKRPNTYIICALVWFFSIVTGSMIAVNEYVVFFLMTVLFEVSLLATFSCYLAIYRTVRKLRMDSHRSAARYNANTANLSFEVEEDEFALHRRVTVRQESRVTNLIFVLVIVLTVTVLPYMVLLQINVAYGLFCPQCSGRFGLMRALHYMFPLEVLNFMLNPVVYAWWLPKFRQVSKKTFRRFCCGKLYRNANADPPPDCSSDTDSFDRSPATIFTGQDTAARSPLNNNRHA